MSRTQLMLNECVTYFGDYYVLRNNIVCIWVLFLNKYFIEISLDLINEITTCKSVI
jgi:hypothetical protein